MIGKLRGRIDYIASDHLLLDVGGVGYLVYCSERTLRSLPSAGGLATLYTELLVREDLLQLFGFPSPAEKEWHKLLTSVQGVGAKAGLAILGALGVEGASRAITLGDAAAIRAAPGVGPKLAQRIIVELRDKAPALMSIPMKMAPNAPQESEAQSDSLIDPEIAPRSAPAAQSAPPAPPAGAHRADALSALVNLGYAQGDAAQAIALVEEEAADASTLIRLALRALAPQ